MGLATSEFGFMILDVSGPTPPPPPPCTKYPLQEYEIWGGAFTDQGMEGHYSTPSLFGKEKGRTFQDACMRYFFRTEYENRVKADEKNEYYDPLRWDYNPYKNTYWALSLYETKAEAWKHFKDMVGFETYKIYFDKYYHDGKQ